MNEKTIVLLNISRWGAAFFVVLSHIKSLILVDFDKVISPSLPIKAFYLMAGVGHEAVVIFFVISGFLVGGVTFNKWNTNGPRVLEYAISRFSRIYTVLIPALLLGGLIDFIGLNWFNLSHIYTDPTNFSIPSLNVLVSDQLSLNIFFQNLVMLETIIAPVLGSNGPLWSLAYEWWYYVLFALSSLAYFSKGVKRYSLIISVIAIGLLLPAKLVLMMSIWLSGFVLYLIYNKVRIPQKPTLFITIFFISMILCRISRTHETIFEPTAVLRDFALGITYCLLLLSFSRGNLNWKPSKFHEMFANFSYSLYLTHFPLMVLIVALNYQVFNIHFRVQPTLLSVGYIFTTLLIAYMYAYIFARLSESHTASIKNMLQKKFTFLQRT